MTEDRHTTPEDVHDERNWTPIPDHDESWDPPERFPPPLANPAPALLHTHEMDWDAFERLILAMARKLDGAYDVRRYGNPGQAQHGLDAVGFFTGRSPTVYQSKRRQVFRAADLAAAVNLYASGTRPFDAGRIVIAAASEARDTTTVKRLAELRAEHDDMEIELWDRQEISDRLRTQPQLVTVFFGPATAASFCGTQPSPAAEAEPRSVASDAIIRGPLAHLGLADDFQRADRMLDESPLDAASLLGEIATRLEDSGFVLHAAGIRNLQARALRSADHRADEAAVRVELGWRHLEAGDPFSAQNQVREIADWGDDAPADVVRPTNALSLAAALRLEHYVTLDDFCEAFDELESDDPHLSDAALVLAEEAVATRRPDVVQDRAEILASLADGMPQTHEGLLTAARLRMCVADCGGDWEGLAASARETYPPGIAALVQARHARYLALSPAAEASVARWLDAVERASVEQLNDDAASWLYAIRTVRIQNGLIANDIDELHRHAQTLRAAGSGTLFPEPYSTRERAIANLRDQKWPAALEALGRYLLRSTVKAAWTQELEAHELLADLFRSTGRSAEAVGHYILAGNRKKLEVLATELPDEPLRLPMDLLSARPWERAAAFAFAAASSDLILNDDAREWCATALAEIEGPHNATPGAPDPWLAAFKAFGQLAVLSTEEQARRFLDIGGSLVPRRPNTYRFTDEDHVFALMGIARAHSALRGEALEQLLQALLVDQRMADLIMRHGHDLLRSNSSRVEAALAEAASEGNVHAALGLIAAETDAAPAFPLARERLEAAVAPRVHEPGVRTFGTGLAQTAVLVTILPEEERIRFARGMLDFAKDTEETAHNRSEALTALRVIARELPDDVRIELLEEILPFAEGRLDTSYADEFHPGADDPLQRFRISVGSVALSPAGLMAAAALSHTIGQYATVQRIAVRLLPHADDHTANAIAHALASLPPEEATVDIGLLAAHPNRWMRALAAVLWAGHPEAPAEVGARLAQDPAREVRTSLGTNVGADERHESIRGVLGRDPRRSVRLSVAAEP